MSRSFIKEGPGSQAAMFAAEAEGLAAIAATGTVRVPAVLGHCVRDGRAFLELKHLELQRPSHEASATLGRMLAAMQRIIAEAHGWHADNFIGPTTQLNGPDSDWVAFFRGRRLGAGSNGGPCTSSTMS